MQLDLTPIWLYSLLVATTAGYYLRNVKPTEYLALLRVTSANHESAGSREEHCVNFQVQLLADVCRQIQLAGCHRRQVYRREIRAQAQQNTNRWEYHNEEPYHTSIEFCPQAS